jgi:tRNA A58 N-methylase Trm61
VTGRAAGAASRQAAREELLREHFDTLAALFDPGTFYRITQLGIGPGWQCWEAGAGGGTVTGWLAERVGETGRVVATDVDVWALEYGIKSLLVRNLEHLTAAQFAKILDTLDRDRYRQEIAAAWIGKEKLRDVLNLRARITGSVPCERQVRDRLFAFYDWCAQHDDIPELITLARTISRWEGEIVAAVITGITNATHIWLGKTPGAAPA